ncbi:MAG: serine/threonine-protein kinase [Cyanobacteria bacterium P01_D01_bin.128]
MPGQILGKRYEVEKQLGRTSGRWTMLATDLQQNRPVVLKLLFIDDHLEANDLRLFKREVETLKLLNHPATSQYLDYFELDMPGDGGKALALVEGYIQGTSLDAYIQRGRVFNESEAKYILIKSLEILIYLHSQTPPIVHRDIRPSNLLLVPVSGSKEPKVHIVDFGSVKSLNNPSTTFTVLGSNSYMSPEQMGGRALAISDLYSLGATLIHGITGKSPDTLRGSGTKIKFESAIALSEDFAQWLKQLVAPSIEKRWSSAQAALDGLPQS